MTGSDPDSAAFRDSVRPELIERAARGDPVVAMAGTYPLSQAVAALRLVSGGHAAETWRWSPTSGEGVRITRRTTRVT